MTERELNELEAFDEIFQRPKAKIMYRKVVKISHANYIAIPMLKKARIVRLVILQLSDKEYLAKITVIE